MLHVLFSISSFIQVSNNEARKCDLNLYIIYVSIVTEIWQEGSARIVSTDQGTRRVWLEDRDEVVSR